MEAQKLVNFIVAIVFIVFYSFQFIYIPFALMSKNKNSERELKPKALTVSNSKTNAGLNDKTDGISLYKISDENNK